MSIFSDPITLGAMAIAAVVGFKLWQTLGRGETPLPPGVEKIMPPSPTLELKAIEVVPRVIWQGFAGEGSKLAKDLQSIADQAQDFDTAKFLRDVGAIHETILNAFAAGDAKKLEPLLSRPTFEIFIKEIERRKQAGELAIFKFVRLTKSKIVATHVELKEAFITVEFNTEVVSAMRAGSGSLISGDEKKIARIDEHWTFASMLNAAHCEWRLTETNDIA